MLYCHIHELCVAPGKNESPSSWMYTKLSVTHRLSGLIMSFPGSSAPSDTTSNFPVNGLFASIFKRYILPQYVFSGAPDIPVATK